MPIIVSVLCTCTKSSSCRRCILERFSACQGCHDLVLQGVSQAEFGDDDDGDHDFVPFLPLPLAKGNSRKRSYSACDTQAATSCTSSSRLDRMEARQALLEEHLRSVQGKDALQISLKSSEEDFNKLNRLLQQSRNRCDGMLSSIKANLTCFICTNCVEMDSVVLPCCLNCAATTV